MRKLITTLALGTLLAGGLAAAVPVLAHGHDRRCGDRPGAGHMVRHHDPQARLEHMIERVGLSAEQRSAVRAIFARHEPEMKALRAKVRESRRQLAELGPGDEAKIQPLAEVQGKTETELAVLRTQIRLQIDAVLTPEQRERLKQRRDRRGRRNG
jgi:Spy/CpxP family protein refolding chaperone